MLSEDERVEDAADVGTAMELTVLETELSNQEIESAVFIRQKEFAELDRGNKKTEEELKDKKVFCFFLLHLHITRKCSALSS